MKANPNKKKEIYKETYKRGQFISMPYDRSKLSRHILDKNVWIELLAGGRNEDGTDFITITINNIVPE